MAIRRRATVGERLARFGINRQLFIDVLKFFRHIGTTYLRASSSGAVSDMHLIVRRPEILRPYPMVHEGGGATQMPVSASC